jgi:integrase
MESRPMAQLRILRDPDPALTVRAVVEAFLADRRLRRAAGRLHVKTCERYVTRCESFAERYHDRLAETLTDNDLARWLIEHPEWRSGYTIEDAAGAVVACFRWARKSWPCLPCLSRPADLIPGKPVRRPLFEEEFRALIRASRRGRHHRMSRVRFRAALFFMWRTGARTCEMREVMFSDVVWEKDNEHIFLPPDRHKTGRKTGKPRIIPLDQVTVSLLRRLHRHRLRGQVRIFINGRGRPYTCQIYADMFRLLADECDIPKTVSAYCTRHAFACRGRKRGFSRDDVADCLGDDPRTVQRHYDAWERQQPGHVVGIARRINEKSK